MILKRLSDRLGRGLLILFILFYLAGVIYIILSIISIYSPSPAIQSITLGFGQGINQLSLLIIGAGLAAITGLITSVYTMELENESIREKTSMGFYYELNELKKIVDDIPLDNLSKVAIYLELYRRPIYADNGLYFILKKDLFLLDKSIIEKILTIYPKIIFIEEQRKNVFLRTEHKTLHPNIIKEIIDLKPKIDESIKLLEPSIGCKN